MTSRTPIFTPVLIVGCIIIVVSFGIRSAFGVFQIPIADEFGWLHAYSPYHHVDDGGRYPAVLLTTAESDTRVDPLHARKMAALLQHAAADQHERPILLHQEGRAGHGVGKPVGALAGAFLFSLVYPTMERLLIQHANFGAVSMPEVFGINGIYLALPMSVMLIALAFFVLKDRYA